MVMRNNEYGFWGMRENRACAKCEFFLRSITALECTYKLSETCNLRAKKKIFFV